MAELLLEILSEEIPARMQQRAAADLLRLVVDRIEAARLDHGSAVSHVTPRRLVVVVDGLPARQPDISEEKKGPKVGAPAQAIEGFVKANGLRSIDDAEVRETPKGSFYFAVRQVAGKATAEVLPDIIIDAVQAMRWPASMRWATGSGRWVRPIWSVIAVFDGAALRAALTFGPENGEPDSDTVYWFGNRTSGHRFMAPEPFEVADFNDYVQKLHAAKVILDRNERRRIIAEGAAALTAAEGLRLPEDPGLLDEVAGLVEWPVVLLGSIDPEFMDLPPEVLTTSMRSHQKYFSTHDKDGRLASRFLVVANMETQDDGKAIVAGNERVLRARLSDARFFWDQDRKRTLASRAPDLRAIVFHAKLGSLDDKADRMQALAVEIARSIPGADVDRVRSAARLAKADLTTGMVGEFPELQGVMGRYYATHDSEHPDVAQAVAEHYAPQGPGDRCPEAPVSIAVALADKIDTLVGFWAIGETPTGSKDPYALRRAALGVIRLIVENGLRLALRSVFQRAYALLESQIEQALVAEVGKAGLAVAGGAADVAPIKVPKSGEAVLDDLTLFFADRLKVALKDKGVRHDLISAVFALGSEDDLVRLLERVKALEAFLQSDDGANLLVAFRRAANIVRIEEKKDKTRYGGDLDQSQLCQDEEKLLFDALNGAADAAAPALQSENFTDAMAALAKLRRPVDRFFDEVTVNADDPQLRINRLRLLSRIGATLGQVADFSRIEG